MSNKSTYEAKDVVQHYASIDYLQKPEKTILGELTPGLKQMKMLDIGVGGGRTTVHFAKLAQEYVGIDYSENMIKACEKRFDNYKNVSFKVCDVRSMRDFSSSYFDFILFSYNGIDTVSHEDRLVALKEIKRVLKNNGLFCFSSHNLWFIDKLRSIEARTSAGVLFNIFVKNPLVTLLNENFDRLKAREYAIIRDRTHWFRLKTYYIKPGEQIKQLSDLGFTNTRAYSLSGNEIDDLTRFQDDTTDNWIYYLCKSS